MEFFLNPPHRVVRRYQLSGMASRRCGFECLEPRQMLAADLTGGAADQSFGDTALSQPGGPTGSIDGSVYSATSSANCDSHAALSSLAEVRVQLLNENGMVIEESSTDATGAYHFAGLLPGQFAVRQIAQNGLLEGTAHVGEGGGIAIDSNMVGEITVRAGETLGGYDFCESAGTLESAVQFFSFLALPTQTTLAVQPELIAEPTIQLANDASIAESAPLLVSRPAEVYGGSGRVLKQSERIKAWDESPLDDYFSTASFLELATAELPTSDAFEPILGESALDNTEEKGDVPFVEGPFADESIANSIEWWEDEAQLELEPLESDADIVDLAVEAVDVAMPMIARLHEVN